MHKDLSEIRAALVEREGVNILRHALIGFVFGIVAAIAIELLTSFLVYVL